MLGLALVLGGCGGGGSGSSPSGGSPSASPTFTPATTPAPAATLPPAPFGNTASRNLPLFGWFYRQGSAQPLPLEASIMDLDWSAVAKTYELSLAGIGSGNLQYRFPGNNLLAFKLVDAGGAVLPVNVSLDPGSFYDPALEHTGWVIVERQTPPTAGEFSRAAAAFGVPTTSAQMRTSGSERYATFSEANGNAQLNFDFAAGTLGGWIGVAWTDAWGPYNPVKYDLAGAQYSRGGTSFSARFVVPGAPAQGLLEGQFMGPGASELVIRWHAPILDPYSGQWTTASGVWIGKPYCSFFVNTPCV